VVPGLMALAFGACGSKEQWFSYNPGRDAGTHDPQDEEPPRTPVVPASGSPCEAHGAGTLPGVTLTLRSAKCTYRVDELITFHIDMVVDDTVPTIDVPTSKFYQCIQHTADPTTFLTFVIDGKSAAGNAQRFCYCDLGLCPDEPAASIKPSAVTTTIDQPWSGHNYGGPSDTDEPLGPGFEPGHYVVHTVFDGYRQGKVQVDLPIEIVP
jgi:hypothetical protein